MASIGLDKLYIAKYNYDSASDMVSYTDGRRWEQVMNMEIDGGSGDPDKLYADNRVVETYQAASEGSVDLGVGHMPFEIYTLMFGKAVTEVKLDGAEGVVGTRLSDGGDEDSPYLGLGAVVTRKVNGKLQYMAAILKKVQFAWPSDSFKTMEDSVEWETPSLSGTVMREDGGEKAMREYAVFDSAANAEKYIKQVLNINDEANAAEADSVDGDE